MPPRRLRRRAMAWPKSRALGARVRPALAEDWSLAGGGLVTDGGFEGCQAGGQVFCLVGFDPLPDGGGQGPGERDVDRGVDAVDGGELVSYLFWGHPGCWLAHDPAIRGARVAFVPH